jgi:translation initiation factor 3 subunit E
MITVVEDEYERCKDDSELQAQFSLRKDEFNRRKNEIFELIDHEPVLVTQISRFFGDKDGIAALKEANQLTLEHLATTKAITQEGLDAFYRYAKFKYECGYYGDAQTMLGQYLMIQQNMSPVVQGALWGKLACDILQGLWMNNIQKDNTATVEDRANAQTTAPRQWQLALTDFAALKESLEFRTTHSADQLRQRAWLLHWGLFVFFNQKDTLDGLVDLFSERAYLQTMENLCPWLLTYYCVAIILSPNRRKNAIKDILQEINLVSYLYSDPITQFIDSLFDAFDFDIAQTKLKECATLIQHDFFLHAYADKFIHEARMLMCEMYCAVHSSVDLLMLAQKLQLTEEEAEKWMVDMVHDTRSANNNMLDAKIDSVDKQVLISPVNKSVHKQVVEVTKDIISRSSVLAANVETIAKDQTAYLQTRNLS